MMKTAMIGLVTQAAAQSIQNCADSSAHLQGFAATISPDPPVKGQDVTMTFKGTMDEDISKGRVVVSAKAGIISIPSMSIPFDISPAIGHGVEASIQVGPFEYPKLSIPLISKIGAHMEMHDEGDDMIACVDTTLPAAQEAVFLQNIKTTAAAAPITICSGSDAHGKNVAIDVSPAQPKKGQDVTFTFTGDFDEAITAGTIEVDIDLVITSLQMTIPFKYSPGTTATQGVKAIIGPFTLPNIPLIPNVKGSLKVSDQNAEEVICANFNLPVAVDEAIEV